MNISDSLIHKLQCPKTKSRLTLKNGNFVSDSCNMYPIVDNVPILINNDNSLFSIDQYKTREISNKQTSRVKSIFHKILPEIGNNLVAEENFRKIINFAKKVKKPIVIHSRKAEKECIDVLEDEIKHKEIDVVQHCFSGKKSQMTRAIELGHYFSIPPNIIIASNFQTLVKKCPLSQLLTETDSPWLSPYKDRPNEPAFVAKTIEKIAEVKGMNVKEVEEQIWQNYLKVFKDKI